MDTRVQSARRFFAAFTLSLPNGLRMTGLLVAAAVLIAAIGSYLGASQRPIPPDQYWGTEIQTRPAPDFSLGGRSLSEFKGRPVVLTFMDPECRDTCPVTAAQLINLDGAQPGLVYLGVNANPEAKVGELFGLDRLPNWQFLNGTRGELEAVWRAYGVASLPGQSGRLEHTSGVFLIDKDGMLRLYVSEPPRLKEILLRRINEL